MTSEVARSAVMRVRIQFQASMPSKKPEAPETKGQSTTMEKSAAGFALAPDFFEGLLFCRRSLLICGDRVTVLKFGAKTDEADHGRRR